MAAYLVTQKTSVEGASLVIGDFCTVRVDEIVSIQKRQQLDVINPYYILIMLKNRDEIEIPFENGKVERDECWKEIMEAIYCEE